MTKEKISYSEAIAEIELILNKIEGGNLDVDDLTKKVGRVTDLLKICRNRLYHTETQVKKILEEGTEGHETPDG
jgi:exodeoxyribonuclease VII small subunit